MTVSQVVKAFWPDGSESCRVTVECGATYVSATEKRATNNLLSLESLCYALVKSGVVADSNLGNILELAAEAKQMDDATKIRVDAAIEFVKKKVEATLPMTPVAATVRVVDGTATKL